MHRSTTGNLVLEEATVDHRGRGLRSLITRELGPGAPRQKRVEQRWEVVEIDDELLVAGRSKRVGHGLVGPSRRGGRVAAIAHEATQVELLVGEADRLRQRCDEAVGKFLEELASYLTALCLTLVAGMGPEPDPHRVSRQRDAVA